jgi:signal transduction histidine kinase
MSRMHAHTLTRGLAYIAAYVGLDYVSFLEPYRGFAITPWNPASGLALAVMLLGGKRYAPFVLLAPAVAGSLVRMDAAPIPVHVFEGLLIGGSYAAIGLLARGLFDPRLSSLADTLTFFLIAVAGAALASLAFVGALSLSGFLARGDVVEGFLRFLIGDLIGLLVVTPLALLAATHRPWPAISREAVLPALAIVLALVLIFAVPHAREYQLFHLLFLPLLWCALRWGVAGAAVALAAVQVGLIVALRLRYGEVVNLVSFQMLMVSLSMTGLVLGTLIGQQYAAEERLRQQQLALNQAFRLRSMGEIASAIAHEINQPVTSIRAFAGIAKDAIAQGNHARAAEAVTKLRSECDRVSATIRSTRDLLSRNELRPELLGVKQVIDDLRQMLLDRLTPSAIVLKVAIAPDVERLHADPVQLKQALYNIVDNSADAISSQGKGGTISLRVHCPDARSVAFEVSDTGPGFAPGLLQLGPSPFVTTKPEGTGLGLSIARSVAEAHGGGLRVEEKRPGTAVTLRFPTSS